MSKRNTVMNRQRGVRRTARGGVNPQAITELMTDVANIGFTAVAAAGRNTINHVVGSENESERLGIASPSSSARPSRVAPPVRSTPLGSAPFWQTLSGIRPFSIENREEKLNVPATPSTPSRTNTPGLPSSESRRVTPQEQAEITRRILQSPDNPMNPNNPRVQLPSTPAKMKQIRTGNNPVGPPEVGPPVLSPETYPILSRITQSTPSTPSASTTKTPRRFTPPPGTSQIGKTTKSRLYKEMARDAMSTTSGGGSSSSSSSSFTPPRQEPDPTQPQTSITAANLPPDQAPTPPSDVQEEKKIEEANIPDNPAENAPEAPAAQPPNRQYQDFAGRGRRIGDFPDGGPPDDDPPGGGGDRGGDDGENDGLGLGVLGAAFAMGAADYTEERENGAEQNKEEEKYGGGEENASKRQELDLPQVNQPYVQLPTEVDKYSANRGFVQQAAKPDMYGNSGIGTFTEQFFNTYANHDFPYSFSEQSGARAAKRLRRTMYGRPMLDPSAYMTGGLAILPLGLQPPFYDPGNSRNQVKLIQEDAKNFMRYASIRI